VRAYRERPPEDRVPRYLLQLRDDQKYALVVDTRRSRLYLYENDAGTPRFLADYYVSSGKNGPLKVREGDEKTPVGVYHITASLPREKLSDFYGAGAFPINYPNEWDRIQGRNGHGIWLHGTPSNTYSRPPRSSNGCVVLANADLVEIGRKLQVGITPVIISEEVQCSPSRTGRARAMPWTTSSSVGAPTGKASIPTATSPTTPPISRRPVSTSTAGAATSAW